MGGPCCTGHHGMDTLRSVECSSITVRMLMQGNKTIGPRYILQQVTGASASWHCYLNTAQMYMRRPSRAKLHYKYHWDVDVAGLQICCETMALAEDDGPACIRYE